MTDQHPITPPSELITKWIEEVEGGPGVIGRITTRAAQWAADQELEACCEWLGTQLLDGEDLEPIANDLRVARRPKQQSLKEQALEAMREMQIKPCIINGVDTNAAVRAKYDTIRRALEALPDD